MNKLSKPVLLRRTRIRNYIVDSLGGKCCCCGYTKFKGALELHHVNPDDKCFSFGKMVSKSLKNIEEEARKCILVCSCCHKEIHYNDLKIPVDAPILNEEWNLNGCNLLKPIKKQAFCLICGSLCKKNNRKYCSYECSYKGQRKTNRPTKTELAELIDNNTMVSIGKMYDVSSNTIKKWAKMYKI